MRTVKISPAPKKKVRIVKPTMVPAKERNRVA